MYKRDLRNRFNIFLHTHIYVACSRPNGWTDWAEIFCKHSWVAVLKVKKIIFYNFFSTGNTRPFASYIYICTSNSNILHVNHKNFSLKYFN